MRNHRNRQAWRDRLPKRLRQRMDARKVDYSALNGEPADVPAMVPEEPPPKVSKPRKKATPKPPASPAIIPRQPYGVGDYLESDRDWVMNNLEACVAFLEAATRIKKRKRP